MYKCFPDDKSIDWNYELETGFEHEFDIYFTKEFFELFKDIDNGTPHLFIFEKGGNRVVYPFLMRALNQLAFFDSKTNGELYDISTPYGYGGPLTNTDNEEFLMEFNSAFERFCGERGVVTEFVRFHPLIQNQAKFKAIWDIEFNRSTVVMDLATDQSTLVNNLEAKNRSTIKAAQKNDVQVEYDFDLKALGKFMAMYNETMKRAKASQYYYFSDRFYHDLSSLLRGRVFLMRAKKDDQLLSMSLFFMMNDRLHYFLSCSSEAGYKYDANNLVLFEAAKWGMSHGIKQLFLGGGKTAEANDPLFRFKKKFNKKGLLDFCVMKKVHNIELYDEMRSQWARFHEVDANEQDDFFPIYRKHQGSRSK